MSAWADRLDAAVRVVVLDVAGVETLDADGMTELQVLARRLVSQGRSLVLAGVTPKRYAKLLDGGRPRDGGRHERLLGPRAAPRRTRSTSST